MTNILLFGIFLLDSCRHHRSLAPSPVPTSAVTPSPQIISSPQTAPTIIRPQQIATPTPSAHVASFMARSAERRAQQQQKMTRSEFLKKYGQTSYNIWKWRWNGAKRGERR